MKTRLGYLISPILVFALSACSTVDSRISSDRAAFDSWPPAVQQRVRAGQVDIGFTQDQVRVALGDPDHVFTRTAANGSFQVWSYRDRGPRFSFGIGMGSFGRSSAYGGGVSVGSPAYPDENMRVIFDGYGRVSSIEQITRR